MDDGNTLLRVPIDGIDLAEILDAIGKLGDVGMEPVLIIVSRAMNDAIVQAQRWPIGKDKRWPCVKLIYGIRAIVAHDSREAGFVLGAKRVASLDKSVEMW